METLERIGMNQGWIYEVIISTYCENSPHSAPIGIWTDNFATLHMEIYKNTKTISNILKSMEFAVNLVSDVTIFYESLFDKAKIAYGKSIKVNAPVIKDSPLVIECKVKVTEEKSNSFHLESIPVHVKDTGNIDLINRAKAITLESLILATKAPHISEMKLQESLRENYRVVKKVAPGSQYERILEMLFDRVLISHE
jgi:hypothetical protein